MPLQNFQNCYNCATLKATTCIPAYSEAIIPVLVPNGFPGNEVILEPLRNASYPVLVSGSLSAVSKGIAYMKILNCHPHSVILKRRTKMASILFPNNISAISEFKEPTNKPSTVPQSQPDAETLENFLKEYKITINPNLTSQQRSELMALVYSYKDIFARDFSDIKMYPNYELKLETRNPRATSYTRQYKLRQAEIDEIDKQISKLESQGLIRKSTDCTFNSPVFTVLKKDKSLRMVVDLRKVNQLIKPLIVSLPKIDELLQELAATSPKFLSSSDFFKGYYGIKLDPKTSHLTAFTNPKTGVSYSYSCLPMGLSNSSGAFLNVMSKVFQDRQKFKYLFAYVDDISIASGTFKEHLQHLNTIFSTIRQNSLRLNPTKTTLAQPEIEFLGHTVNKDGIKISDTKMTAIKNIKPPTTKRSLQRLFGLLQYFRKYVGNFSQRTCSMRQLLRQDTTFKWNEACDAELSDIKSALESGQILAPFKNDRRIYIYIDGSLNGLGSVALQFDNNGKPQVNSFLSYAVTEAQKRYSIYQLEMLALGLTLKQNETIFLQADLEVFTDNAVVASIQKYIPINNREKRLLAYINQFKLTLKYIPGRLNKIADALSRLPEDVNSAELKHFQIPRYIENEEFILPLQSVTNDQTTDNTTERIDSILDSDSPNSSDNWTLYSVEFETLDLPVISTQMNEIINQDAGQVNVVTEPASRTSARIQERRDRGLVKSYAPKRPTDKQNILNDRVTNGATTQQSTERDNNETAVPIDIGSDDNENTRTTADTDTGRSDDETTAIKQTARSADAHDETEVPITSRNEDMQLTDDDIYRQITVPKFTAADYMADPFFKTIYNYLQNDILTGDEQTDRKTLLLSENYYIQDELLIKLHLPRGKKDLHAQLETHQICVPSKYTNYILKNYHEILGHFSAKRLYPSLQNRFYWRTMAVDASKISKYCDVCQRSKILTNPNKATSSTSI